MLTLATNTGLGDGVAPDKGRTRSEFPYFGVEHRTNRRCSSQTRGQEREVDHGSRIARRAGRRAPSSYGNSTRLSDVPEHNEALFSRCSIPRMFRDPLRFRCPDSHSGFTSRHVSQTAQGRVRCAGQAQAISVPPRHTVPLKSIRGKTPSGLRSRSIAGTTCP